MRRIAHNAAATAIRTSAMMMMIRTCDAVAADWGEVVDVGTAAGIGVPVGVPVGISCAVTGAGGAIAVIAGFLKAVTANRASRLVFAEKR